MLTHTLRVRSTIRSLLLWRKEQGTMTHCNRWQRRFSASSCLLLATVDLSRDYAGKLFLGNYPAHWECIMHMPELNGVRFNLTKGWHCDDAATVIGCAHDRRLRVMVDIVSRLRITHVQRTPICVSPGTTLDVYITEDLARNASGLFFNRRMNIARLPVGQRVLIRDGRACGYVVAANEHSGKVVITVDRTDQCSLALTAPPVNFPGWSGGEWTLTSHDHACISLAVQRRVELLAVSFANTPDCAVQVRRAVEEAGRATGVSAGKLPIIVLKPETAEGLRNLPATLSVLDDYKSGAAIEVPRGDLAVELPRVELGLAQEYCFNWGRMRQVPVGVATGLLGSMQQSPEPSRADVGDAWAALRAGAAFLLLADETANDGLYPREAITALHELRELAEGRLPRRG